MRYALIALVLAAGTAHAQYRCTAADGSTSLQQAPCPAGARSERLDLAVSATAADRPEHIRKALALRQIATGMTRAEVDRVFARQPDAHSTTADGASFRQQLVYKVGRDTIYVYLRDGVVTASSRYNVD